MSCTDDGKYCGEALKAGQGHEKCQRDKGVEILNRVIRKDYHLKRDGDC